MIKSIYVKERSKALVNGYIPLYTQAQNIHYEPKHRDSKNATQHFVPFSIKIKLPPPRLAKEIIERDRKGRILHSITSAV